MVETTVLGCIAMMGEWVIRSTTAEDEWFLWEMLFYASHSDDEPNIAPEDIRGNVDLAGYIEGWRRGGRVGVPELAVAVVPGKEGEGIGSDLIRQLLDNGRGRFRAVVLSSRAENPAVRLYERLGFRVVGEIINRVGTRSVKMVIDL